MTNDTDNTHDNLNDGDKFTLPQYDYGFFYKKLFEINENISKVKKQMLFASNDNLVIDRFTKIIEDKLVPQFDLIHSKITSLEMQLQKTAQDFSEISKHISKTEKSDSITELSDYKKDDMKQGACHKTVLEASKNLVAKEEADKITENLSVSKNSKTQKTNFSADSTDFETFVKQVNDKADLKVQTKSTEILAQSSSLTEDDKKSLGATKKSKDKSAIAAESKKEKNSFETLQSKIQEEFNITNEQSETISSSSVLSRSALLRKNQEILSKKLQELSSGKRSNTDSEANKSEKALFDTNEERFISDIDKIELKNIQEKEIPTFSLPVEMISNHEESFADDDFNLKRHNQREMLAELQKILKEKNLENHGVNEK